MMDWSGMSIACQGGHFIMPARTRNRSKPASPQPLPAGQVYDLIAACQPDLPEIGEEVAPPDPEVAPRRLPPTGFDLSATIRQEGVCGGLLRDRAAPLPPQS